MQRDELADLCAFAAVAEERSFTGAAAKLGTSQSALSYTLRRLEARLGVRLLHRTTRSVTTTEAGERLLRTLRPALDQIDAELASLTALRDKSAGTIRITTSEYPAQAILWPAISQLISAHPGIKVELNVNYGLTDIVAERFDAGVRLGEQVAKDMVAVRIGPEIRMALVGAPAYVARWGKPVVPQDLVRHRCINLRLPTSGGLHAWEFEKDGRAVTVRVEGQLVFNRIAPMILSAEDGLGLAFLPEDAVRASIDAGRLVRAMEDWCPAFPGYHLYYPSHRQPSPAFSLLIDLLRHADA